MLVEDLDFKTADGLSSGTNDYNTGFDVDGVVGW